MKNRIQFFPHRARTVGRGPEYNQADAVRILPAPAQRIQLACPLGGYQSHELAPARVLVTRAGTK